MFFPPLVSAICDEEAALGQELLFTAIASDKGGGRIISYEWDLIVLREILTL